MMRTSLVKLVRAQPVQARSFSVLAARAAEGDLGGTRFGGTASSDSLKRREDASEAMYVRQKEKESLMKLKEKLKAQRAHLDELDKHIEDMEKSQDEGVRS